MESTAEVRMPGMDLAKAPQFVRTLVNRVSDPGDTEEDRLQKAILVTNTLTVNLFGLILVSIYLLFDEPLAALSILAGTAMALTGFAHLLVTHKYRFHQTLSLLTLLLGPFLLTLILGGIANASAVILFTLIIPTAAVTFNRTREATGLFLAALALLLLAAALQPFLRTSNNLPSVLVDPVLLVVQLAAATALVFGTVTYLVRERDRAHRLLRQEQDRSERLLLNVLPKEVVPILKQEEQTIASYFESASILFADIAESTPLYEVAEVEAVVAWLNEIYSHFDGLTDKYGLEKIRNNGDNYMVAAGVPVPRADHAETIARLALEMNHYLSTLPPRHGRRIECRMGIHSGPVVAGVIGRTKFHYDTWGDTVNVASRMESHGLVGKIQITEATCALLKDNFVCEARGVIDVKGKGAMRTWFLVGQKP